MKKQNKFDEEIPILLEEFLKRFGISGIFNVPGFGTLSLYADDAGKLKVLDQSRTELVYDDILRQKRAEIWAIEKMQKEIKLNSVGKEKVPKYFN